MQNNIKRPKNCIRKANAVGDFAEYVLRLRCAALELNDWHRSRLPFLLRSQ